MNFFKPGLLLAILACGIVASQENVDTGPEDINEVARERSDPDSEIGGWQRPHEIAPDVTVTIERLARHGARVVKLDLTLNNGSEDHRGIGELGFGSHDSLRELALIDFEGGMKYGVVRDDDGVCACTHTYLSIGVDPGESKALWAYFAAPPLDVSSITVEIPVAISIDNVPIQP